MVDASSAGEEDEAREEKGRPNTRRRDLDAALVVHGRWKLACGREEGKPWG